MTNVINVITNKLDTINGIAYAVDNRGNGNFIIRMNDNENDGNANLSVQVYGNSMVVINEHRFNGYYDGYKGMRVAKQYKNHTPAQFANYVSKFVEKFYN